MGAECRRFKSCRSDYEYNYICITCLECYHHRLFKRYGRRCYYEARYGLFRALSLGFDRSFKQYYRIFYVVGFSCQRLPVSISRLLILSAGSVAGGITGQFIYNKVCTAVNNNNAVIFIQNICLLILMVVVFVYMLFADKIKKHRFSSAPAYILSGFFLGFISSFLGIGGGPINVAVNILFNIVEAFIIVLCVANIVRSL